jgi:hypothetical protein
VAAQDLDAYRPRFRRQAQVADHPADPVAILGQLHPDLQQPQDLGLVGQAHRSEPPGCLLRDVLQVAGALLPLRPAAQDTN